MEPGEWKLHCEGNRVSGTSAFPNRSLGTREKNPDSPYRLLGILDPDRNHTMAFAMKIPSYWLVQPAATLYPGNFIPVTMFYCYHVLHKNQVNP